MDPEEETALDTGDNPNAGPDQAPVPSNSPVEDDATGVNEAVQRQQQPPQPQDSTGPNGPIARGVKGVMSYLMGAGAAHPSAIDQAGRQTDPSGGLSPADRNLYAISHIRDTEGDNAAWQLMQANRVAYNAKTAFAKEALTGNQQRPASIDAALSAANEAQAHVLDGTNVVFAKHNGMITATVTPPGSKQQMHINLTPQAFSQFLDVGGDGQWDKVMDQSAVAVLQRLATQPAQQVAGQAPAAAGPRYRPGGSQPVQSPQASQSPDEAEEQGAAPSAAVRTGQPQAKDVTQGDQPAIPGTHDAAGHYTGPQAKDENDYGDELEERSRRMFPSVNQEQQRQEWMAGQEQQGVKNAIEDKKADHQWSVESARVRAAGGVEAARVKAEGATRAQQAKALEVAKKMMEDRANLQIRENGKNARSILSSPNWFLQTDAEREKVLKKFGINVPLEAEPEPTAAPAAPAAKPAAAGGGEKREYKGKMYTREEYERDVLGKH